MQSANAQEASLVCEFIEETIDLLVLDGATLPLSAQRRLFSLISSQSPDVRVLVLAATGNQAALPSATVLASPYDPKHLVEVADSLTHNLRAQTGSAAAGSHPSSPNQKRSTAVPR